MQLGCLLIYFGNNNNVIKYGREVTYLMKKNILPILIIICFFSLFIVGCMSVNENSVSNNKMIVHYINVGQGDSILVQVNNKNMLIDAGPKDSKEQLISYLKSLKIESLDYVIATHPHEDHIGNMADVINNFHVVNFYAPKVESTTKTFEMMILALKNNNLKINVIKADMDSIDLGEGTTVSVFSPNKEKYENLNNYSPIIKVEYGQNSFLFTGDAEKEVEKEVLSAGYNISADVLKLGHHGSSSSTSEEFFKKVNPSIGVISLGIDNSYGHPHKETLDLIKKNNITLYRTDLDGNVVLVSDGQNITIEK